MDVDLEALQSIQEVHLGGFPPGILETSSQIKLEPPAIFSESLQLNQNHPIRPPLNPPGASIVCLLSARPEAQHTTTTERLRVHLYVSDTRGLSKDLLCQSQIAQQIKLAVRKKTLS